jgi:tRNA(Ser,Leu) C12 N-acetylase TAN1
MRSLTTEVERASAGRSDRRPMTNWNVLATAKNREQRYLARRLKRFGDFRWAPYPGVLIGRVEDHQAFFDQLRLGEENEPGFLSPLARLVPLDRTFIFTMDTLIPLLKAELPGHADRIGSGSFHVRVERRGHKDEINSRLIEQEIAGEVIELLVRRGCTPHVDFHDPEVIIAIEIVGDECGVGFITKSLRDRYPFIKVP